MPHPRIVFVDVYIDDPNTDPPQFRVIPSAKNEPDQLPTKPNPENPDQPEIIFRNAAHDGFQVHFELQDDTHGYFFPPQSQKHDAIWSECGSVCPMGPKGIHQVFQPLQVVATGHPPQRRTLIVFNKNPETPPGSKKGQGKFKYNLRVTNGTNWKNLDPPGDNTNGSVKFYSLSAGTFVIAGAVATAAFFAATRFDFVDGNVSGTALLAALTVGFAAAALWERVRRS